MAYLLIIYVILSYRELQKAPLRNRSILHLGRSFNFDETHSETVAALSLQLFDSAKQIGFT